MITIDDPEIERLALALAMQHGHTVHEVVRDALRARAAQLPAPATASPEEQARRRAVLLEIRERASKLPILDPRSADDLLGYDESGLPT